MIIHLSRCCEVEVVVAILADIEVRLVLHHTAILHRDAVVAAPCGEVVAEAGPVQDDLLSRVVLCVDQLQQLLASLVGLIAQDRY